MQVKFRVAAQCKAPSDETIEPGEYSGTRNDRPDINAPGGRRDPVYILERPRPAFPIDVSALVKSGEIMAY